MHTIINHTLKRPLKLPKNFLPRVSTSFAVTLAKITDDNLLTITEYTIVHYHSLYFFVYLTIFSFTHGRPGMTEP